MAHVPQQYQQGGYMNICMHPFVSGRALRIAMLDRLISRMKALPGVWFPTCEQVARHIIASSRKLKEPRHALEGALHDQRREEPPRLRGDAGRTASAAASASSSISAPACGPDGITPRTSPRPTPISACMAGSLRWWRCCDRHGIKATFAVPAVIAEIQADTIRALPARATRSPRTASSTRM